MKLSCSNIMVPGRTLTEKAEKLADWGYEGISVFADYVTGTKTNLKNWSISPKKQESQLVNLYSWIKFTGI